MSQHDAPGAVRNGDVPTAEPSPWASDDAAGVYVPPAGTQVSAPSAPVMPWVAPGAGSGRSGLEWAVIGIASFGLLISVISLALPWEYQLKEGRFGFGYYYGAAESGGYSYTFLLAALVLTVVALQFVPPKWNPPLRISGAVVALLLIGLVSGIAVNSMLGGAENDSRVHLGWGLFLAYVALPALGVAAALSPARTATRPYQAQG